jgi:hypothetical protein
VAAYVATYCLDMTVVHSTPLGKVDPDYRHGPKLITPADPLVMPGAHLKWYDIRRETQSFVDGIDADSREFIRQQAASGGLPLSDDLGFVINHLSGDHVYLLLVFTWRGNNEMWESAYYRDVRDEAPFQLIPGEVHRATICVWEFGAVAHEHRAWTRYLYSARDEGARRAYLADQFSGTI